MAKKPVEEHVVDPQGHEATKTNFGYLDAFGRERPDPRPMEPPLGYRRSPTLAEQIAAAVRSEALARAAEAEGMETFDEADDFDVGDDYDPSSPYEQYFEPTPMPELRRRYREDLASQAKAGTAVKPSADGSLPPEGGDGGTRKPAAA